MKPEEIQKLINTNNDIIRCKEAEISNLRKINKSLKIDKKQSSFTLVLDYIEIGDVIEFNTGINPYWGQGGLRRGDRVEVIKKNAKSVVIKYLYREPGYTREKVGSNNRIVGSVFGEWVYNTEHLKVMIARNSALKKLLDI